MKIHSINNSQPIYNKKNNYSDSREQAGRAQINFGHYYSGRGGNGEEPFDGLITMLKLITAPVWGPIYLGNKFYKNQRAKSQQKLEEKARLMAEELYENRKTKDKTPAELLTNFINASVIANPEKGLNKVIGHGDLKLDMHARLLSPILATINGDKDLVKTNSLPNAVVFFGPNGCGKTYFIEALGEHAKELGMNFVEPQIDAFDSMKSVKNVSSAFKNAEDNFKKTGKYTFIYIDELDSFATDRKLTPKHLDEVNTLLKLTENCSQRGAIWLGATNNIKYIDRALMDRVSMTVPMPPMQDHEVFDTLIYRLIKEKGINKAEDLDFGKIVNKLNEKTNKYSPRNIEDIAKMALVQYKTSNANITTDDILNIIDNKITPKVNQRTISELNEDIDFAKNEGYIKNSYSEFKFEKDV